MIDFEINCIIRQDDCLEGHSCHKPSKPWHKAQADANSWLILPDTNVDAFVPTYVWAKELHYGKHASRFHLMFLSQSC